MQIREISSYNSPEVLAPLVANFGADPLPLTDRKTLTWVAVTDDGTYAATAIVRLDDHDRWHLWFVGVLPWFQRHGAGGKLLSLIENSAREAGAIALRTRTYSRWTGMRCLLVKQGWAFVNAAVGEHHDGVEEEWLLPLRREPLRVVLVGANSSGRGAELAGAIKELSSLVRLVGVCDINPNVLKTWSDVPTNTSIDALLDQVDADAAVLALPHSVYQQVRQSCLERGLGLFHEKPLACSLSELLDLQDALTERPTPLVVGVQRRSHPSYVFLKRALQHDLPHTLVVRMSLGRSAEEVSSDAETVTAWRKDADTGTAWRKNIQLAGGGALIDIGYHAIDLVHFLLDAPFATISCNLWVGNQPATGGELETAATLVGRAGNTWVKVVVDRAGIKSESVVAVGHATWKADRTQVSRDGLLQFSCEGSWDMAVRGQLVSFVIACSTTPEPVSLWDHLAELRVIEQARTIARAQGLGEMDNRK